MTKNIVLLSDGTGNSSAKAQKTNVWRLFQAINQSSGDQIALYDDGVGTSTNKYLAAFGGAFGWGLKRNILTLYKFVCRNYEGGKNGKPGDAIYGFGFSRGAFTIRVLVGLIESEGLVVFDSEEELSRNALAAYRHYRAARFPSKSPIVLGLRWLRDILLRFKDWLKGYDSYAEMAAKIEKAGRKKIKIKFLGLWDTVEAYGVPMVELKRGIDWVLWPMMFGNLKLSPVVERACHALSLDDERRTFHPLLWDEAAEAELVERNEVSSGRITQVWFAGAHSNVGGGYPEDQLSLVTLEWMMGEAMANGLRLDPAAVNQVSAAKSYFGRLYDSRAGLSSYYRYAPRRVTTPVYGDIEIRPIIHGSVVMRMANGSDRYAPISLPRRFWVLAPDGELLAMEGFEEPLQLDLTKTRTTGAGLTTSQAAQDSITADQLRKAVKQFASPARDVVSLVWDTVWWRKLFYFTTVLLTAALVLRPWLSGFFANASRTSLENIPYYGKELSRTYDHALARINESSQGVVSTVVDTASGFIPSYAQPWSDALRDHPVEFIAVVIAILISLYTTSFLKTRVRDRAWLAWHARHKGDYLKWLGQNQSGWRAGMYLGVVASLALLVTAVIFHWPPSIQVVLGVLTASLALLLVWRLAKKTTFEEPDTPDKQVSVPSTFALSLARKLRNNTVVLTLSHWIFQRAVPIAFAFCLIFFGMFVINRVLFDVASSAGAFCRETPEKDLVQPGPDQKARKEHFTTAASCWATGIQLEKGHPYRITIDTQGDWFDGTLRSDVDGSPSATLSQLLGTGLKRWWGQPWFKPIARVGRRGNNEYVLDPVSPRSPHIYCTDPGRFGGRDAGADSIGAETDIGATTTACERNPTSAARQICACKPCHKRAIHTKGIRSKIDDASAAELLDCSPTPQGRRLLISDITPRRSGELFIYVNDTVLMWPGWSEAFYANNRGTGDVTVTSLSP